MHCPARGSQATHVAEQRPLAPSWGVPTVTLPTLALPRHTSEPGGARRRTAPRGPFPESSYSHPADPCILLQHTTEPGCARRGTPPANDIDMTQRHGIIQILPKAAHTHTLLMHKLPCLRHEVRSQAAHVAEQCGMALAVGVQVRDQLLPRGAHQVLCQRQVPNCRIPAHAAGLGASYQLISPSPHPAPTATCRACCTCPGARPAAAARGAPGPWPAADAGLLRTCARSRMGCIRP